MAKQRGIVQLSGRVDNLCYYQQKRVRGGLVRRINLAMSERVKVGAEYQRLRAANSYFGGCSISASTILNMTGTRARFLHFPDRQAILTKGIFDLQKNLGYAEGGNEIYLGSDMAEYMGRIYDGVVKNKFSRFLPSVPYVISGVDVDTAVTIVIPAFELENFCLYNKCKGVLFTLVFECFIYSLGRDPESGKFSPPGSGFIVRRSPFSWVLGQGDLTISFGSGTADDTLSFAILSALPIVREVSGRYVTKDTGAACRMICLTYN